MSWLRFKQNYEKILEKEIEVEIKFNPQIPGKNKHRLISDIMLDKAEEKVNFGFDRFQAANPDRIKILKYNLNKVQSEKKIHYKQSKSRPQTSKKLTQHYNEFFVTNQQFNNINPVNFVFSEKYWRNTSIVQQQKRQILKKDTIKDYQLFSPEKVHKHNQEMIERVQTEKIDINNLDKPKFIQPLRSCSVYHVDNYIQQTKTFLENQKEFKVIKKNTDLQMIPVRPLTAITYPKQNDLSIIHEKQKQLPIIQEPFFQLQQKIELEKQTIDIENLQTNFIQKTIEQFKDQKLNNHQDLQFKYKNSLDQIYKIENNDILDQDDYLMIQQVVQMSNKGRQFDLLNSIPFKNFNFTNKQLLDDKLATFNKDPLAIVKKQKQYKKRPQTAYFYK